MDCEQADAALWREVVCHYPGYLIEYHGVRAGIEEGSQVGINHDLGSFAHPMRAAMGGVYFDFNGIFWAR